MLRPLRSALHRGSTAVLGFSDDSLVVLYPLLLSCGEFYTSLVQDSPVTKEAEEEEGAVKAVTHQVARDPLPHLRKPFTPIHCDF
jgi:hypothetical protein